MLSRRMSAARAGRMAWVPWTGFVAMGAFSSLFVLTALRDVALLAGGTADMFLPIDAELGRFRTLSAAGIPVLAALVTVIGFFNARRRAAVREVNVPIHGLPAALEGFTIAQISDVHVGATIRRSYVSAIVDAVNALKPDLIAVTGDIVDGSVEQLAAHTEPLGRLSARHGAFFITGNHEYYSGAHAWIAEMQRLGLVVLMNEHRVLDHDGADMLVAGINDFSAEHFDPSHKSDPAAAISGAPADAAFRLLLAHQPRSAFAAKGLGFDLQLSGHTHGGQFVPWIWFVRLQQPFTAGLHRLGGLDGLWVYVSRGTGYWGPPKRFGAPSEITLLRLKAAAVGNG
jgi:predicted MPP superfamily phosphohydrolase